jgi:glycosyltransferase involved in cell wall biosynthesis
MVRARLSALYAAWFLVSRSSAAGFRSSLRILVGQFRADARLHKLVAASARPMRDERLVVMVDQQYPHAERDAGGVRAVRTAFAFADVVDQVTVVGVTHCDGAGVTAGSDEWPTPQPIADDELAWLLTAANVVWLSRPTVAARVMPMLGRAPGRRVIVYDTVDLHFVRLERQARIEGSRRLALLARLARWIELLAVQCADVTITTTEDDRVLLERLCPRSAIDVVPTVQDIVDDVAPLGPRSGMLFFGSFGHEPNVDAAMDLVTNVLPRVAELAPGVHLTIAGANPPHALRDLASDSVRVAGWVRDLDGVIDRARVFVAPLRYGGGMKGKIALALARGLPVVTTTIGAEGFGLVDGVNAVVTDDAAAMARACAELLSDDALWQRISEAGLRAAHERVAPELLTRAVRGVLERA